MDEHEQPLLAVFERLSDGLVVGDEAGRVLYMNPAAERLIGRARARAEGRPLCELLCDRLESPSTRDCPLRAADSGDGAVTISGSRPAAAAYAWHDERLSRRDGGRHLRVRCLKTPPAAGRPGRHLTLIEDASEEENRESAREEWRRMIAHDLRNPLTAVQSALTALQDCAQPEILRVGLDNCRRMAELLDLYLDVGDLESSSMPVSLQAVDADRAAAGALERQKALAERLGVELSRRRTSGLRALADPALLARVFQNLLDNALKFTPAGGRVELDACAAGPDAVEWSVVDTGCGIPAEELPRLFERESVTRARQAGKIRGNGLGLDFCRRALEAMGGSIRAESELGRGSAFRVTLPRAHELDA